MAEPVVSANCNHSQPVRVAVPLPPELSSPTARHVHKLVPRITAICRRSSPTFIAVVLPKAGAFRGSPPYAGVVAADELESKDGVPPLQVRRR